MFRSFFGTGTPTAKECIAADIRPAQLLALEEERKKLEDREGKEVENCALLMTPHDDGVAPP